MSTLRPASLAIGLLLATTTALAQTPADAVLPEHGFAAATAVVNFREVGREGALAPEGRRVRPPDIHRPLSDRRKERVTPPTALTPLLEQLYAGLAPKASTAVLPAISPTSPQTLTGFPGLLDNLVAIPPDTFGAVGPLHVVTALNTELQIQTRSGAVLSKVSLDSFFEKAGQLTDYTFDPRVLYDRQSGRWIAVCAADARRPSSSLLVGVSQTPDPTGNWLLYRIDVDPTDLLWFDFPTVGFAGPWIIVSGNMFNDDSYERSNIYVFSKADLYTGNGSFRVFRDSFGTPSPAVDYDNSATRAFLVQTYLSNFLGAGSLRFSELQGTPGSETLQERFVLAIPEPWNFTGPNAPQKDSSTRIDTGDGRMQNCVVRNTSIWCAHTVFLPASGPNRSVVQWVQMATTSQYGLVQRGRIEDPTGAAFYSYPSIAVNRNNDALIGYNRFSATEHAGSYYSLRLGTDPLGQLQSDTLIKLGEASYRRVASGLNRWGDYSHTVVDPVDDVSFWTVQEYAGTPNSSGRDRWGTWWAQVTPLAAGSPPCDFQVTPLTQSVSPLPTTFTVRVTVRTGCKWMAASNAGWATLAGGMQGDGNGVVDVSVSLNPANAARNGSLTVAGRVIPLTQQPNANPQPDLVVTAFSAATAAIVGQRFNVTSTIRNQGALRSGRFRAGFYYSSSPNVTSRDTYSGSSCTFDNGLEAGANASCNGNIGSPLSLTPGVFYVAMIADDQNEVPESDETNNIRTSDAGSITLTPDPTWPVITAAGVANAASTLSGPVAPGLIVVIYGLRMGPAQTRTLELNSAGAVTTSLAGTRVLFDGVAAPLVYTSAGQVSAIVPYAVAGRASTQLQIEYNNGRSNIVSLAVAPGSPALFTVDFSGRGQGAILNQDGSVNSIANPAARGSVVVLYGAGAGQLIPAGVDGQVIGLPLPVLTLSVSVLIGGLPGRVLYAGPAPGLVSGVVQINVELPAGVSGVVPITLAIGGVGAPAGVTVAVRP